VTVHRDVLYTTVEEWRARMEAARARLRRNLGLPPEDDDDIPM
jgi:hypothetical protein